MGFVVAGIRWVGVSSILREHFVWYRMGHLLAGKSL